MNGICAALVVESLILAVPAPQPVPAATTTWKTSALITFADAPPSERALLVGMTNTSQSPRLVCVTSRHLGVRHPQHEVSGSEGSSHSCRVPAAFRLVQAGETYYRLIHTESNDLRFESARLSIGVDVDQCVIDASTCGDRLKLEWIGTVKDAMGAARRISRERLREMMLDAER
jgi:hypothetical protein